MRNDCSTQGKFTDLRQMAEEFIRSKGEKPYSFQGYFKGDLNPSGFTASIDVLVFCMTSSAVFPTNKP